MRNCGYKFINNNCQQFKQNNCNNMNNNKSCNNNLNNNNCCGNKPNNNCKMQNNNQGNRQCNNFMDNEECPNQNMMEELRLEIQQTEFSIIELALYLDTHPDDYRAICMHNELSQRYRKLTDEYQKVYGPLTIMFPCNSWRWLEQPWPWQNSSNILETQFRGTSENKEIQYNNDENCVENDYDLKGGVK